MINIPLLRQKARYESYNEDPDYNNYDYMGADDYQSDNQSPNDYPMPTPQEGGGPLIPRNFQEDNNPFIPKSGSQPEERKKTIQEEIQDILDIYNQSYTPKHTASDRLDEFLKSFPKDDDYRPSIGRAIVAGGLGLGQGGYKTASDYMDAPMARALGQWKEKATPYQQAATLENQQNINERTLAGNVAGTVMSQRKLDEQQRSATAKEEIARQKNEIIKAKNDGATFDTKGEYVIGHLPNGAVWNTGVKTTAFNPMERAILDATTRTNIATANNVAAGERNAATIAGAGERNAATIAGSAANTAANNAAAMERKTTPAAPGAAKPGDAVKIRQDTFQKLHDTDQVAARWIEMGPDGKTWQLKSLEDDATEAEQYAYANLLTKLYPLTPTPAKKDIVLPREVQGVNSGMGDQNLRQKATDYLRANNLPITDANIQHAISTGRVK